MIRILTNSECYFINGRTFDEERNIIISTFELMSKSKNKNLSIKIKSFTVFDDGNISEKWYKIYKVKIGKIVSIEFEERKMYRSDLKEVERILG
jgi:hypothetical protein